MNKTAVIIIQGDDLRGVERETAQRVSRRLLSRDDASNISVFEIDRDCQINIGDLRKYDGFSFFVLIQGALFITYEGINILAQLAFKEKDISFIAPVCNESFVSEQRHSPSFIYQTISVFKWVTEEVYREFKDIITEVEQVDSFCLSFRSGVLDNLPRELNLLDLPNFVRKSKFKLGVAKGVYVHRYGNVYESSRDDLLPYIPLEATEVLDIGCARGLFGEILKKRQRCVVTGVDMDAELINTATGRLDNVIDGDIEDIVGKGTLGIYDCIVCGDILEHLNNPWKVVKELKYYLKKGGIFIASTPNVNNWAIIYEMLKGRWDYVPFSILSGTHIRFFTKKTFTEMFKDAGYEIKDVLLQSVGTTKKSSEFVLALKKNYPYIEEEELNASEIVMIAEA